MGREVVGISSRGCGLSMLIPGHDASAVGRAEGGITVRHATYQITAMLVSRQHASQGGVRIHGLRREPGGPAASGACIVFK